jgi:hypothetical protein
MTHIGTEKLSPSISASTTSILHQRQAHIKESMRFSITKKEYLGAEQRVQTFKEKGMQTQYEVKFLQSVFALKVELFFFSRIGYGSIYSLQMEMKGRVGAFLVYGRSRIMDLVTWHGNPT